MKHKFQVGDLVIYNEPFGDHTHGNKGKIAEVTQIEDNGDFVYLKFGEDAPLPTLACMSWRVATVFTV
jgi:hypothetical protein